MSTETKKPDKVSGDKQGPIVLCVIHAKVKAFSGAGTVVAVVKGESGNCRLYGVSNLVKLGLIPDKYYGQYLLPDVLATLLDKPLIIGAVAARKYLTDNKVKGVVESDIVEDAFSKVGRSGKSGKSDLRTF